MTSSFFRAGDWVVRNGEASPRKIYRVAPSGWISMYDEGCSLKVYESRYFSGVPLSTGNLQKLGFESSDQKEWRRYLGGGSMCIAIISPEERHIFLSSDKNISGHFSGRLSGMGLTVPHLQHLLIDCGWQRIADSFLL